MKNYFETEAFVMNAKEFQYSKGAGYNFSFAIKGEAQNEDKNSAPVVWISGVSFNQPILDKRSYLLRGKLQVKPPYKDYPAGLQLIVSEAILLESGMYVVARKRAGSPVNGQDPQRNPPPEPAQAPKQVQNVPEQATNSQGASYQQDFPEHMETIPF